jgi:ribonuclease BN (tRNA processing enzyme)
MNTSDRRETILDRRALLKNALMLVGLGAGAAVLPTGGRMGSTLLAQAGRGARGAGAVQTGTTLVLLGTQGGPNVNLVRGETASAVLVNGQPYLVDCGYGTLRALVQAGIPFNTIANVFITHLHDDHTADIAALLSHKWTGGNTNPQPATVRGPYGTAAMVEGAIAFFKANTEIRMVDEGRTVRPETIFSGKDLSAPKVTEVFRDDRVTVQAMENAHFPDRAKEKMLYRSFAYRFNMADRSIVFSGDTAYSTGLIELAKGADILVCEAMSMAQRQQLAAGATPANGESIGRHVLETHSSTEEVGRMASEAKVKTVVLNHLLPGGNGARGPVPSNDVYTSDVKKFFDGEVVVGADQMRI